MTVKVVRVIPVLDFGGVESMLVTAANVLDRGRFDLRVCTFWKAGHAARQLEALGVPVDVLDQPPSLRNPRATLALARYLRAVRPDVVHAAISEANFHCAWATLAVRRPRLIMEEVGVPSRSARARRLMRFVYRRADAVIGVAQQTCDYLRAHEGVSPDRLHLLYNCFGPELLDARPVRRVSDDGRFELVMVGRLDPVKNHALALHAVAALLRRGVQVRLRIVGEGPERAAIARQVEGLGLGGAVELLGFRQDIRELVGAADAFILPSHSEGLSVALVEAMALGVPVLASRVGGTAEAIGPWASECLLPPEDPERWAERLAQWAQSPDERARIGEGCALFARERFGPETYAARLASLYLPFRDARSARRPSGSGRGTPR